ncbi:multiprotein bridging factor aMBF1 [Methanocaldococcus infernus]|uniref:Transcriptional regulator, XRE family n=1 Tax=Methanocaldococcus infernus (strain DSM 11812 / JCM 15783 / ME) TaxID=573063 RepID=D5VS53_METIM|nr:multiprotein bridging factor aMBF1 [Methanocaldococcus infernus]ADG13406.1 transcriptional regulator, XRE family [Methanocaldococcus infernus ME]
MQMCELCGKLVDKLYKVMIEGSEMYVCKECLKFGKAPKTYSRVKKVKKMAIGSYKGNKGVKKPRRRDIFDSLPSLREDYGDVIRKAREKLGLSIEELAEKLKMKATVLHKFERYELEPSDEEIKKLEKFLKVKLTESSEGFEFYNISSEDDSLTLGHFLKIKK